MERVTYLGQKEYSEQIYLMDRTELVLCDFSRGQLGWVWDLSYDLMKDTQKELVRYYQRFRMYNKRYAYGCANKFL